jgi:beta-lactamase regulating signal transducer with metallopeptidase domain
MPAAFHLVSAVARNAIGLNAAAQMAAAQIVDCLVEGTLIAIFAGMVLGVARRQNSGARFAVWFSALMAIAVLPLFGGSWWSQVGSIPAKAVGSVITVPGSWALYAAGAWAVIAACSLLRVGRGLWHLHVLRKSCMPVDAAGLDPRLQETLERNQTERRVKLCTSDLVNIPTAVGFVNPRIIVPRWVMQELSADELNQILLHELAHLRRWDDWTNLAQKLVKALLFFHPAVWWIEKRVSLEREMACDDVVIAETASPRAYAECLTHLAERTLIQRSMALAQAALGRIRQTSLRVAQILDVNRPASGGRAWKSAVSLVAGFAVVCVLSVSRAPKLVAFSDNGTGSVVAGSSTGTPLATVPVSGAVFRPQSVRVVPASLNTRPVHHNLGADEAKVLMKPAGTPKRTGTTVARADVRQTNVRLTNARLSKADVTPVVFTHTFFVIVEGAENGASDQPVYQIQLWRVMVVHPVVDPNNKIPAKQT